ncbi:Pentatricopeptide repeat-containing protein [Cynara cardunculus var. scolymus]|uniref:Pentatricopeptide repeat-containing protein n=1 Tax=Cynara cardunculus var. scolymus TaxID=59895 RepID=A0A118JUQ4_CYNCS|nr:Pentatricopeptide repeat-containing protein [Cynara cardunculus var. scolymus]
MNFMQIRRISTLLDSAIKNPNSSLLGRRKWIPIPIPHRTIHEPRGQDLDYINVAHSHLLHSDWAKLDELLTNFDSFRVKHVLLKLQNDYAISLKFFKWVETHNPNLLTLETNCIILHILTKNHKFVSAESVLEKIVGSCDVEMHSKLFDAILHSYRMCDSTPRVFDALFKLYAQMKQFRNATDTFCRMKEYGFLPTIQSCNLYMSSLLSLNRAGIALSFYKEIRRSKITVNVFTLNIVINAFCQLGELENAVKVFDEMQDMGFNGKTEKGNEVFEEMLRNGIKADILTYNALLLGLCNEGKTRKAAYLVKELDKKKLVPNSSTFAALIRGQCARKNPDRALKLYKSMLKSGCRPNEHTLKMLMLCFLQNDDYGGVFDVLKEMLERPVGPDLAVLRKLCKGLSQAWKDRLIMNLSNEVDDGRLGHGRYEKVKSIITQSNAEGKELEQNA